MGFYKTCGTLFCGLKHDMLNYAPCPPPMMEYINFYEHALKRNLSHVEVCDISRRCRLNETLVDQKCITTTTGTTNECNVVCLIIILILVFVPIIIRIIMILRRTKCRNENISRNQPERRCKNVGTTDSRYEGDKDLHEYTNPVCQNEFEADFMTTTSSSREHTDKPDEVEHKPGQQNLFTFEIEDDKHMFITHL
ncbi:uncharacterized protein LOC132714088 [Ruditapes philippinarum]|uniref:uncharacterized protein LOC132714088 n=1 Tax=Ruditapes philippinarum TaxID=129788 RepID=UPI00295AFE20|nr:uncharacterized protein LOC132714088 [Ruditapes philippinarum]